MNEQLLENTLSAAARAVLPLDVPHDAESDWACRLLRVRWLVLRFVRRFPERLVQADGSWSDIAVGPQEFRRITGLARLPDPVSLVERLGVPALEECERVLDSTRRALAAAPLENPQVWFGAAALAERFGLSPLELDLLVCAAAPRLSTSIARLYPFVWSDFTTRQPPAGFLAELVADSPDAVEAALGCLHDDAPLLRHRLLVPGEHERWAPETPRIHAPMIVPRRIAEALRGATPPDTRLPQAMLHTTRLADAELVVDAALRAALERHLHAPAARLRLEGSPGSGRRTLVQSLQRGGDGAEAPLLVVDLVEALAATGAPTSARLLQALLAEVLREARLLDATLLLRLDDPDDALLTALRAQTARVRGLLEAHPGALVIACDERSGAEAASLLLGDAPRLRVEPPPPEGQLVLWQRALRGHMTPERTERVAQQLARTFRLPPGAIVGALASAADHHRRGGGADDALPAALLVDTVQRRMTHRLGWLAETLVVEMTLDQVVFPTEVREQIDELLLFARHGWRVMHEWGMGSRSHGGLGLSVLFSGPPGTGKTLTAAVLGHELGRLVYRVDLSRVVDKYIGETEKNLGRVFDEAERAQAILLFDEADSLFAKRTSVKSSNDRYANLEVNYLLQRLEAYAGVCILTTNFATSIDDAFQRRIRFKIEFSRPERAERRTLWQTLLPPAAPLDDDIDWDALAQEFEFTGGHIRNAILRACIRAAELDRAVDTELLYDAALAESRELGLLVRSEL